MLKGHTVTSVGPKEPQALPPACSCPSGQPCLESSSFLWGSTTGGGLPLGRKAANTWLPFWYLVRSLPSLASADHVCRTQACRASANSGTNALG